MFICKRCGKEHDGTFGSGKFCSRSCANTKIHSKETKEKISRSVKIYQQNIIADKIAQLVRDHGFCIVCGSPIEYKSAHIRKTCSHRCAGILSVKSRKARGTFKWGGENPNSRQSKFGYYEGIRFASTYELVYYIYSKDHGINLIKNTESFNYFYKGSVHKYTPDFKIIEKDGSVLFIEIKGYYTELVELKLQSVIDAGFPILVKYKEDLEPCFKYVQDSYLCGAHYEKLYDSRFKSS